ncbi:pyridoxamine 5'-phosphate oxidase [Lacinutrix sp. MedPE-SW]|uniref:pyridoxamine 5'-phosphate oxidase n=1 Tax=Lacinutrix sp. MedPE-SW TaxID=1860087 RepID=UPI00091B8F56|nr:pyridoxamine 5'-phosphate oxidase [Lacinutrix sp. MedPE-SW]OIQ15624.1 MAG: pyridoxamine 5'-phosphate oxidase [Lacinutrix sp. MedPE-SW]
MNKDLSNYRKSYEKGELLLKDTPDDAIALFAKWFKEIDTSFPEIEANAMTLSTIGLDGFPKNRVVLLKSFNKDGFVFYSNYESEKGKAILKNPNVCLSFFWPEGERQVIIKGIATKVSEDVSDNYFNSRPRGSRLGAIASNQSDTILSRDVLEKELKLLEIKYENKSIPRPKYWGGFNISPVSIEFWQGRANRLHDRILYKKDENKSWKKYRLAP